MDAAHTSTADGNATIHGMENDTDSPSCLPFGSSNCSSDAGGAAVRRQLWLSPVPQWDEARAVWGIAWPLHTYTFATVFAILFFVSAGLLWKAVARRSLARRSPSGKLNQRSTGLLPPPVLTLLALATFLRALCIYADPYNSEKRLPVVVARTLGNLPFTCFISAYQLLFLALHSSLKIKLGSLNWLQNRVLLFGVIGAFMLFNTIVDIVLVVAIKSRTLLLVCMIANVLWMAIVLFEFLVITAKLHKRTATFPKPTPALRNAQDTHVGLLTGAEGSLPGCSSPRLPSDGTKQGRRPSMVSTIGRRLTQTSLFNKRGGRNNRGALQAKIVKVTLCLAVSAWLYLMFMMYYTLGVSGAISFSELIVPWTWYVVATFHRLAEVFLVVVIIVTMSLASGQRRQSGSRSARSDADSWPAPSVSASAPMSHSKPSTFLPLGGGGGGTVGGARPSTKLPAALETLQSRSPTLQDAVCIMFESSL